MPCRTLYDPVKGYAVFYCTTSEVAFGPLMKNGQEADAFTKWLAAQFLTPRGLLQEELTQKWAEFQQHTDERRGHGKSD